MLSEKLIKDASLFKYNKGDKFKLFGVVIEIKNFTYSCDKLKNDSKCKLYEIYSKDLDYWASITESFLKKHGERV